MRYSNPGFTIGEIVVTLFFVATGVALVAGLGQQVIQLSKRSTQTGVVIEFRNTVNSLSRNTDSRIWRAILVRQPE